jgi:vacuolar protein sorting-associated protein 72
MAAERSKRANAGKNISKLLQQEEDLDGFYSTAYGGFEEESGDDQYSSEEEEEDQVDSDFDKPEDEGNESEEIEVDEPKTKKKKLSQITAKSVSRDKASRKQEDSSKPAGSRAEKQKKAKVTKRPKHATDIGSSEDRSKNLRKSTVKHTEQHKKMRKEKEKESKKKKVDGRKQKRVPDRPLTQAELLEEAKLTEVENLKSLEAFAKLEEEKKKTIERHHVLKGPVIRYLSVTMPLISEESTGTRHSARSPNHATEEITNSSSLKSPPTSASQTSPPPSIPNETQRSSDKLSEIPQKYSRNFLIFTDVSSFPGQYFPRQRRKHPKRRFCPITGQPAKYYDAVTKSPYATAEAFKALRSKYVDTEQQKCEKHLMQLSSWLEEKKRQIVNVT